MNLVLAGGGMKVSYQIGQTAALVERFGPPETVYTVSSGLITASIVAAHGSSGESMINLYRDYLHGIAHKGVLPSLRVNRTLASSLCCDMLRNAPAHHVKRALVFGACRSSFAPFSVDLLSIADPYMLEALMSIPNMLDSHFSKKLGFIDGGYIQNIPWHFAPPHQRTYVLSYFSPSPKNHRSFDEFEKKWKMKIRPQSGAFRHAWAWVNSTYPHHPLDRENLIWCMPSKQMSLNFFSRKLASHMEAIDAGYADVKAQLSRSGRSLLRTNDDSAAVCDVDGSDVRCVGGD